MLKFYISAFTGFSSPAVHKCSVAADCIHSDFNFKTCQGSILSASVFFCFLSFGTLGQPHPDNEKTTSHHNRPMQELSHWHMNCLTCVKVSFSLSCDFNPSYFNVRRCISFLNDSRRRWRITRSSISFCEHAVIDDVNFTGCVLSPLKHHTPVEQFL